MSNQESARIYTIWSNVEIDGERAKVSCVRGIGKILFASCGFDIPMPGKFYDVDSVVQAYKDQIKQINKALANPSDGGGHPTWESSEGLDVIAALGLSEDTEIPGRDYPQCFVPITEDELDHLTDGTMIEDLGEKMDD